MPKVDNCRGGPTELKYTMFKNCPITCGVDCGKIW